MSQQTSSSYDSSPLASENSYLPILLFYAFISWLLVGTTFTLEASLASSAEGHTSRQIIFVLLLMFMMTQVHPFRNPKNLLVLPKELVLMLAWCWLSIAWSDVPDIAVRRITLTSTVILTLFLAVSILKTHITLKIVTNTLILLLAVNFLIVFLLPTVGVHQSGEYEGELAGDWRGILGHKNYTGVTTALTILLCLFNPAGLPLILRTAVLIFAAIFIWKTNSKTAISLLIPSVLLGFLYAKYYLGHRVLFKVGVLGVLAIVAIIIFENEGQIIDSLNDPEAFTGRTQIWAMLCEHISKYPLLGVGYGSFWNVGPSSPIYQYNNDWTAWVTELTEGHQGYLDIIAQIGVPGLLLVLYATIGLPFVNTINLSKIDIGTKAFLISIIVFVVGHNFTESSLIERDSIPSAFLMITIAIANIERRSEQGLETRVDVT